MVRIHVPMLKVGWISRHAAVELETLAAVFLVYQSQGETAKSLLEPLTMIYRAR